MGEQDAEIDAGIGIMQKIAACIVLGLVMFTGVVVLFLAPKNSSIQGMPFPMPAVGLVMCFVLVPLSFFAKSVVLGQGAGEKSMDAQMARYRTATIVALALCEGAGFALLVFTIVSGAAYVTWAAGVLIPLAGMVMHFPTRLKFDGYRAESAAENI